MSVVTDYGVQVSGSCRKCGDASSILLDTMAHFTTCCFPGLIDMGLSHATMSGTTSGTPTFSGSISWGCYQGAGTCWTDMGESPHWTAGAHLQADASTGRVYADHDRFLIEALPVMSGTTGATLSGMLTLGADYLITEPELQQFQNNIQPFLSLENAKDIGTWSGTIGLSVIDSELCTRILRNLWEAPTYWGGEGEYVKYNSPSPEEEDDFSTYFVALSGTGYIPYGLPLPIASGIMVTHIVSANWPD